MRKAIVEPVRNFKTLNLTKNEVEAVIEYIWIHVRATNGKAKRVCDKMQEFLEEADRQGELFK
ncbi:MAG: hypothetical protein KF855_03225 [Acidobacteria bacterium]|nr:hypothetical protein [Acidobacteriota bacterium]